MVNTCVAVECESGYLSQSRSSKDEVNSFCFPIKKTHLLFYWERFVNRQEWKPTKNSVLCEKRNIIKFQKSKEFIWIGN